jgi:acyl-coenzyme A synthetase/AMP-(fatty) acid ligase
LTERPIVAARPPWHDRSQRCPRRCPCPSSWRRHVLVRSLIRAARRRGPARRAARSHRRRARAAGRATPTHPALIEDARRLSYAELAEAVDTAAARLVALGVRGGDRVMIVAENSVAQIVLLLAAARVDAWALVSNARLAASELDAIAAHARPKLIAFATEASPDARAHAARYRAAPADALPIDIGAWSHHVDADAPAEPVAADGAAQCAALIYTTGTTGAPKA